MSEFSDFLSVVSERATTLGDDVLAEASERGVAPGDYSLAIIAGSFRHLMAKGLWDEEDNERTTRDGKWDTEWYVFEADRGEMLYKSEDAAKQGGRYWLEHSLKPSSVEVYTKEVKRYNDRDTLDREDWHTKAEATS